MVRVRTTTTRGKEYVQVIVDTWDPKSRKTKSKILRSFGRAKPEAFANAILFKNIYEGAQEWKEFAEKKGFALDDTTDAGFWTFGGQIGMRLTLEIFEINEMTDRMKKYA